MLKFLLTLLIPGALVLAASYFVWRGVKQMIGAFSKVEFVYVRFRDGVLVLSRQSRFGEEEVQFTPTQEFSDLAPKQLAAHASGASWFTFPDGFTVERESEEAVAIERCLRFAHNTGLLQAEAATE